MTNIPPDLDRRNDLRSRAVTQLRGADGQAQPWTNASAALGVLYQLASSQATAPDALALLHELQVHQVEVDLQDEELRRSRLELEAALHRQVQLYDCAPTGQFTVDGNTVLRELNRSGARLLGIEREFLRGRSLESLMTPEGVAALRAMLARVTAGDAVASGELQLRGTGDGEPRRVRASACLDPAGGGFLVGMTDA
jgi:PAS domain S-box-containing protein